MIATVYDRSGRIVRRIVAATLIACLAGAALLLTARVPRMTIAGHFASAVGLYPGDQVRIAGVPVGTVVSIRPQPTDALITMSLRPGLRIPADARAVIIDPNLVAARFIELAPLYRDGPTLPSGAVIGSDRTAVPVEWDQVKDELTKLATRLGPQPGSLQAPLAAAINQAADTFDGQGDSFRTTVRELSRTAGRLSDDRSDLFGTVKNLYTLIDTLSASNEQIVSFAGHVAAVSAVLADSTSDLSGALDTLNQALADVRGFLTENNAALIGQVNQLADYTGLLNTHSDDLQQVLHVAPNGLANLYNIYNPAQASLSAILTIPNFGNPAQFLCGTFDVATGSEYVKRAEICRERMAPVLKRLAMNYPPILFHPIQSINAYPGQIIYDTPGTEAKSQAPLSQLQWVPAPGHTPPTIPADASLSSLLLPSAPPGG